MPSFLFSDPYPEKRPDSLGEVSDDVDEINFEIDSNVSDADLLELRAELKKLQPEKIQRDLADATRALQEMALRRWIQYGHLLVLWDFQRCFELTRVRCCTRYCHHVRCPEPVKLLKKCDASAFIGFLIWYEKNHPRARRLNSYESLWKGLRQLYYDEVQKVMDESVGKLVTKVTPLRRQTCLQGADMGISNDSICTGRSVPSAN